MSFENGEGTIEWAIPSANDTGSDEPKGKDNVDIKEKITKWQTNLE